MLSISLASLLCLSAPNGTVVSAAPPTPRQDAATDSRLTPAHVRVPGTRVFLVPPRALRFPPAASRGISTSRTGSSLMVTAVPGPYAELVAGFDDEQALRRQGMVLIEREDAPMGDADGPTDAPSDSKSDCKRYAKVSARVSALRRRA